MMTNASIVLTIFGEERCVTTFEDLEAVAKVIHTKAVREPETSANTSTLAAEIEGQIRLINAESDPFEMEGQRAMNAPALITYPAR
jgi:hypothetical protein